MKNLSLYCFILIAAIAYGLNTWRAATLPLWVDEVQTKEVFVADLTTPYWVPNNHPLNTWICWASIHTFGDSLLTFRAPALIGTALFLTMIGLILYDLNKINWLSVLVFAAIVLNQEIAVFMVLARGYILGTGLLLLAYWLCDHKYWKWAGFFGGLSIVANLSFAFPILAVGLVFLLKTKQWKDLAWTAGICFPLALALIAYPYRNMETKGFSAGCYYLIWAVEALLTRSNIDIFIGSWFVFGFLIVGSAYFAVHRKLDPMTGTLLVTIGGCIMAHLLFGAYYPSYRTGLYLIPLMMLSLISFCPKYIVAPVAIYMIVMGLQVFQFDCLIGVY